MRRWSLSDTVSRVPVKCSHCGKEFFVLVKPLGKGKCALASSPSAKFTEPREVVEALDLRFDYDEKVWQRIAGDRVVGQVRLSPKTGKRRR